MLLELDRFIEIGDTWFGKDVSERSLADLVLDKITVNTEYVVRMQRYEVCKGIEFCEVYTVDRGNSFVVAKTYEEMRALLDVKVAA